MIGDRWGVREEELGVHFACDEYVPDPTLVAFRGVTVDTTPDQLWPWVAQIRSGPYSYDWIDNGGRRSPQTLLGLPEPTPGERYSTAFGRPVGKTLAVDPGTQLTGRIMGATMSYLLVPEGITRTRLLLKIAMRTSRVLVPFLSVGDLVMARRQLLNLKRLAESS